MHTYQSVCINLIQYQSISSLKVVAAKDAGVADGEPSLMPNAVRATLGTCAWYTSSQQRGTFKNVKPVSIYHWPSSIRLQKRCECLKSL